MPLAVFRLKRQHCQCIIDYWEQHKSRICEECCFLQGGLCSVRPIHGLLLLLSDFEICLANRWNAISSYRTGHVLHMPCYHSVSTYMKMPLRRRKVCALHIATRHTAIVCLQQCSCLWMQLIRHSAMFRWGLRIWNACVKQWKVRAISHLQFLGKCIVGMVRRWPFGSAPCSPRSLCLYPNL